MKLDEGSNFPYVCPNCKTANFTTDKTALTIQCPKCSHTVLYPHGRPKPVSDWVAGNVFGQAILIMQKEELLKGRTKRKKK